MKTSCGSRILILWIMLSLISFHAGAEVIFNGFNNSSGAYDSENAALAVWDYEPLNPLITAGAGYAQKFTAMAGSADWLLEAVVLPVAYWHQLNVRVSIVADQENCPTGAVIWSVTNPSQITTVSGVRTLPASGTLAQGASYWLVVEPAQMPADESMDVYIQWQLTSPPRTGVQARLLYDAGVWSFWSTGQQDNAACAFNIHGSRRGGGSLSSVTPSSNPPQSCKQRCAKSRRKLQCLINCVKSQIKARLSKSKQTGSKKAKSTRLKTLAPSSPSPSISGSSDCNCSPAKSVVTVDAVPDFSAGSGPSMILSWTYAPGYLYEIQYSTSLAATDWSVLKMLTPEEAAQGRFVHTLPPDQQNLFYRLMATPPDSK